MTSIHPLALIARSILPTTIAVDSLLPSNANPHFYHLRPSDVGRLQKSHLFFWVGPGLETFLGKIVENKGSQAIAFTEASAEAEHGPPNAHDHSGAHHHSEDLHLWLNLTHVDEIAETIASHGKKLVQDDEAMRDEIDRRLIEFKRKRLALIDAYQEKLHTLNELALYSRHDSLGGLKETFGLVIQDTVSQTPEKKPGLAKIASLKEKMEGASNACYLSESIVEDRYREQLAVPVGIRVVTLDLTGAAIPLSEEGYFEMIQNLLDELLLCRA